MEIPDYQSLMLPLLQAAADGNEHTLRATIDILADQFKLSETDRQALLPSGQQPIFENRVGWARTYIKKAGLIATPRRGVFIITARGSDLLKKKPQSISNQSLMEFPEFQEFRRRDKETSEPGITVHTDENSQTPEELIEYSYQELKRSLADELLLKVKEAPPEFFEKLVVELLLKMGYGGSRSDAGQAIGKSGDEGIDGIIKEDRLGLDLIYLQAKRWENVVSRPEIQKFVGALQGQRASKGIFITTSRFSTEAHEYVNKIENKVVLIDGERLAQHMIDFDIGVSKVALYELKRIDTDYFVGE